MPVGFRDVVSLAGPGLPGVSFLARLPGAMFPIGTLLLVTHSTGSVGEAGLVAGALALGQAVGGPMIGRLTDRAGQRPVLLIASVANGIAATVLVLAAMAEFGVPVLTVLAALLGATDPQIGPLARARWSTMVRGRADRPRLISAALSLESVLDESSFVAGPALVGVLSSVVHPAAGVLLGGALTGSCGVAFALHRTAPQGARPAHRGGRVMTFPLAVLCALMAMQGVVFGAGQTGVTALAEHAGRAGVAGLVWAVLGVTSALAGIGTAALPARLGPLVRLRLVTLALAVLGLPLLAVDTLGALVWCVAVLGLACAPHLITLFGLAERIVPGDRLGEAMSLMVSGVIVGTAIGTTGGGGLADAHGYTAAFALACAGGLLAFVTAVALGRSRRYERSHGGSAPATDVHIATRP